MYEQENLLTLSENTDYADAALQTQITISCRKFYCGTAARTAGGKHSEAPQSDRPGTTSLGHFIHKGKWHTVEKKNVHLRNRIKRLKAQGHSGTSCTKLSNVSFQNHTIKENTVKQKETYYE